jgi:hypothetical protein
MRISFDIDETLVCRDPGTPIEVGFAPAILHRWFGEPLRKGSIFLIKELRRQGCSIWIYTTSVRTSFYIRRWLFLYGIRIDGIVNDERHRHQMVGSKLAHIPSKYPPAFGIDLHVDDSEGVRMEGDEHGFEVVIVRPYDEQWTQKVLEAVTRTKTVAEKRA